MEFMKDNYWMGREMGMENFRNFKEIFTRDSGKMVKSMAKEELPK